MKLSRTVAYALRATLMLAESDSHGPVPCRRLAADGHMPERFLLQILRSLVMHGVLESTRGVDGGYRLNRDAEEISLLDVIEAIDGPFEPDIPIEDAWSDAAHARLSAVLEEISAESKQRLQETKLSALLAATSL